MKMYEGTTWEIMGTYGDLNSPTQYDTHTYIYIYICNMCIYIYMCVIYTYNYKVDYKSYLRKYNCLGFSE